MLTLSGLNSLNIYLGNSACIDHSYIHRYIITLWCLFDKQSSTGEVRTKKKMAQKVKTLVHKPEFHLWIFETT